MSSLPDVFRTMQSQYIRPTKQGGIFTLKFGSFNKELAERIQPEQFYSVKWTKVGQSRIGTSHTIRTQHFSSMTNTRPVTSSQSHRKITSRKSCSRPSSQSIRKDIFANYGNSRVTFVIGQTSAPPIQQAESLIHQLNENINQSEQCSKQLAQIIKTRKELKQDIAELHNRITEEIQDIQDNTVNQLERLRKLLSTLRRSSGMDTKVNKTDANELNDSLKTIGSVMDDIDVKSRQMHQLCLK